jgi:hypothetical protein
MMEDRTESLIKIITAFLLEAQEQFGGNNEAIVDIVNASIGSAVGYIVQSATKPEDREKLQERYDELAEQVMKVTHEFLAKYTGACITQELRPKKG